MKLVDGKNEVLALQKALNTITSIVQNARREFSECQAGASIGRNVM
jgi:hypothetical protein